MFYLCSDGYTTRDLILVISEDGVKMESDLTISGFTLTGTRATVSTCEYIIGRSICYRSFQLHEYKIYYYILTLTSAKMLDTLTILFVTPKFHEYLVWALITLQFDRRFKKKHTMFQLDFVT